MTEAQKQRLSELKAKKPEELEDHEKDHLELLETMEKMAKQIEEKDSLLGKRATDLDNLKKDLEKATDGKEKEALEKRIKEMEEALEISRVGLQALKDAQEQHSKMSEKFPKRSPGHGGDVDPAEIAGLEKKVKASEEAKAAVEKAVSEMTDEEWSRYQADPAYKKQILQFALPAGDSGVRNPWGEEEEPGGEPPKSAEDRMRELFGKQAGNGQRLPPNSSGRGGRGGRVIDPNKPTRKERPVDNRTE